MLGLPNEAKEAFFWQNIVNEKTGRQNVFSRQLFFLIKDV
jgi:hypothetical protein